jgi:molybdopterin-guanine dinucleotide biosynthesis protein A
MARVAGVVLAGGRSSRMGGGDKCLLPLAGRPILSHVIDRLRPQLAAMVISANGDLARFAGFGLPVVADSLGDHAGPLSGIHAGMAWARANLPDARCVISVACDTPFFPADLVTRFRSAIAGTEPRLLVARSAEGVQPVFGLWPIALAPDIERALQGSRRKVSDWVRQHGAEEIAFPPIAVGDRRIDPFFNINRPEDLAEAEALLRRSG